jgi:AraC-like DNA-binding protein
MHDRLGAAIAADRVGYESASQFSREFKHFFGSRPMEESKGVREIIGLAPPESACAEPM